MKFLLTALLYRKLKDPHEYIASAVMSPLSMFPILNRLIPQIVNPLVGALVDESPGYRGKAIESMGVELINSTLTLAPKISTALAYEYRGDDARAEKAWKQAMKVVIDDMGTLAGLPTETIGRVYEGWFEEEQEFKGRQRSTVKRKH